MNLYTTLEVSIKLNIKEAQVKRLVKEGRIKIIPLNKIQYRITDEAINDYLAAPIVKTAIKKHKWTDEEKRLRKEARMKKQAQKAAEGEAPPRKRTQPPSA